jgi:hypothetical protein
MVLFDEAKKSPIPAAKWQPGFPIPIRAYALTFDFRPHFFNAALSGLRAAGPGRAPARNLRIFNGQLLVFSEK